MLDSKVLSECYFTTPTLQLTERMRLGEPSLDDFSYKFWSGSHHGLARYFVTSPASDASDKSSFSADNLLMAKITLYRARVIDR